MANELTTSASFVTPVAYTGSTAFDTTYTPLSNIGDYTHPSRFYRSAALSSGTTYCGVDLGAATSIAAVAVFGLNIASIKIQAGATDGASTYDSGALTVSADPLDGVYKIYHVPTTTAYRHWRVLANTATTTDSTAYMQCGAFCLFSAITTWTYNPGFPWGRMPMRAVSEGRFDGGGREPVSLGNRYAQLSLSQDVMPNAGKSTVDTVLGYGEHTPFLLYRNFGDTSEVYIVRRVGLGTWQQSSAAHHSLSSLLLETVC